MLRVNIICDTFCTILITCNMFLEILSKFKPTLYYLMNTFLKIATSRSCCTSRNFFPLDTYILKSSFQKYSWLFSNYPFLKASKLRNWENRKKGGILDTVATVELQILHKKLLLAICFCKGWTEHFKAEKIKIHSGCLQAP